MLFNLYVGTLFNLINILVSGVFVKFFSAMKEHSKLEFSCLHCDKFINLLKEDVKPGEIFSRKYSVSICPSDLRNGEVAYATCVS